MDFNQVLPPMCLYNGCRASNHHLDDECEWVENEDEHIALIRDQLGNYWCELHAHHGKVIDYGAAHGWPEIDCHTFVLPGLPVGYIQVMMYRSEDDGWIAEAAMEYYDQQQRAS